LEKTVLVTYVRKAEPLAANPLMVSDYNDVTIIDYFPLGALDPEDGTRRSRASDVVVADEAIDDAAEFFRYRPDLGDDPGTASVVTGGTLPVRIDFYEGCDPGQTLRLSVVCNAGHPEDLDTSITPISNGNTNYLNYFRCGEGSGWYYNLDLDASGVPLESEVGTDAATCAVTGWGDVGAPTRLGYFYRP
jgi:hypothetical protein